MQGSEINGAVNSGIGDAESLAGRALNDPELEAKGKVRKAEANVQKAAGKVQDAVGKVADHATDTIHKLGDRAQAIYAQASDRAQALYGQASERVTKATETVTPMVRERPIPALAIAAAAGFVLGALLMGRGARVVYVKDRLH